ncbi:MAG: hypothetical protein QNJ44_00225 [Rhodobacter sp.]|nr:hypothetical protein [Rhodobacter sp.]
MDIILHIGAHRCGSTAVERVISQNARVLREDGVEIWPPKVLRAIPGFTGLAGAAKKAGQRQDLLMTAAEALAERLQRTEASGVRTLIWSEENLIGGMYENLVRCGFYENAASRLDVYAAFLPAPPTRVALAIRSYEAYWVSAYLYLLGQRPMPDFANLAESLARVERGWRDLIADVQTVFPDSEIVIWQQEQLAGNEIGIACRLIGRTHRTRLAPAMANVNATRLTPGDMAAMHRIHAETGNGTGRERRHALQADRAERTGRPEPEMFAAQTIPALKARYERDVSALQNGFGGVQLFTPGKTEALL